MRIELSQEERASIEAGLVRERGVRHWRRYQAIRLLAEGHSPRMVAATLGVSVASVYNWAEAWRRRKHDGMKEGARPGRTRRLDAAAEGMLATWLAAGPRAFGHAADLWTVPLLCAQLARRGYACSEHTLRRTLHRLGWRWRGTGYVLAGGRARPAGEGAASAQDGKTATVAPLAEPPAVETGSPSSLPAPALGFDAVTG